MGHHDNLPALPGRSELRNQFLKDRLRIEVLFRLIDHKRSHVMLIECQVQQQQDNPARPR